MSKALGLLLLQVHLLVAFSLVTEMSGQASLLPNRTISRVVTLPPATPGFLGEGHTAIEVIDPRDLQGNDPFVLLMDDRLDLGPKPRKLGGAHPHAGIETVTLFLAGSFADKDEGDTVAGDAQWMTAGRGIVHGENVVASGHARVLQLWIRLPLAQRYVEPRVQLLTKGGIFAPVVTTVTGAEVRVYSGSSNNATSATLNYASTTLVDFALNPGGSAVHEVADEDNGFLYVIEGAVLLEGHGEVRAGQVAWFHREEEVCGNGGGKSVIKLGCGSSVGGRAILYSGRPQNYDIIHHGPFCGTSRSELQELFNAYRRGEFKSLSEIGGQV
jgi:redox-sensitive bicupin YhaK (pirin superfamily)